MSILNFEPNDFFYTNFFDDPCIKNMNLIYIIYHQNVILKLMFILKKYLKRLRW